MDGGAYSEKWNRLIRFPFIAIYWITVYNLIRRTLSKLFLFAVKLEQEVKEFEESKKLSVDLDV